MRWRVRSGDILDEKADILVCSANAFLTLSGGVGGALLLRYGPSLQAELNDYLKSKGQKYAERGTIVVTNAAGTPYQAIVHAVAVNAFYESSPDVITEVVRAALSTVVLRDTRTVTLTALATGYGKLTMTEFAHGLLPLVEEKFPPLEQVTIVVKSRDDASQINRIVSAISMV